MPRNEETSARMREESRKSLLAAARHCFAADGYFNCTVSDVARQAEMSQGNVYWYFKSKDALLKAVLQDGFAAIEEMTAEVAQMEGSSREKIEALIEQSLALYDDQKDFLSILLSLLAHGGAPFMAELGFEMEQIGRSYHANLIPLFSQARQEGLVTDIEANLHIMHFFGLINGLMITYGEDWRQLPVHFFGEAVLRLLGVDTA